MHDYSNIRGKNYNFSYTKVVATVCNGPLYPIRIIYDSLKTLSPLHTVVHVFNQIHIFSPVVFLLIA